MLVHPWVYLIGCIETWFWESTICLTRATAGPCSHCKSWSSIGSFTAYPSPPTSKLFSTSWWGSTFAWPDDGRKAWLKTTWNITSCDQASERRCPYFLSSTWIFCSTSSQSWQIRSITPKALAQFVAGKPQTDFCTVVIEQNSGDLYKHYIFI